jgi:hypothetical protein
MMDEIFITAGVRVYDAGAERIEPKATQKDLRYIGWKSLARVDDAEGAANHVGEFPCGKSGRGATGDRLRSI